MSSSWLNTTVVAIINHMGTNHNDYLNALTVQLWNFCYAHNMWVTACHIPGEHNIIADRESRKIYKQDAEWRLNTEVL